MVKKLFMSVPLNPVCGLFLYSTFSTVCAVGTDATVPFDSMNSGTGFVGSRSSGVAGAAVGGSKILTNSFSLPATVLRGIVMPDKGSAILVLLFYRGGHYPLPVSGQPQRVALGPYRYTSGPAATPVPVSAVPGFASGPCMAGGFGNVTGTPGVPPAPPRAF